MNREPNKRREQEHKLHAIKEFLFHPIENEGISSESMKAQIEYRKRKRKEKRNNSI